MGMNSLAPQSDLVFPLAAATGCPGSAGAVCAAGVASVAAMASGAPGAETGGWYDRPR